MKGIKTSWDLALLYKNPKDPQMEQDIREVELACAKFEKRYRGKDFVSTPARLAKVLKEAERISELKGGKPIRYFWLKSSLNTSDVEAQARITKYEERHTKAFNKVEFFYLEIAKIPKGRHKLFLRAKILEPFHYKLEKVFKHARYNLSEGEEQLSNLLSQTSYSMWIDGQQKVLNEQTIEHKGKKMPVPKAIMGLSDMSKPDRRVVHAKILKVLRSISDFAESELNAILNYKKILDDRRGYEKPYSSTVLSYEQKEGEVEGLVELISKNFDISRKFFKLHAKLLGEKKISMADRAAKIGKINKKFDFETAVSIVKEEFEKVDPRYSKMLEDFVRNGQFDVYPKKGKEGGAYCAGGANDEPTFIMLNHTDDIGSVETLAHEMGHAIHTELSKKHPLRYQRYSMAVAETASTFFEQVVSDALENHLSDKERIILLHNKILGDIATIFRQIALFNFEVELHRRVREKGQLPKTEIAALLNKHMRSYVGDAVELTEDDGYFFVYWSHIRRFFYVYSYTYGQLVSRALFERWKKDPSYAKKIEKFLSAGKSMSPADIFKSIGINTKDPKFFLTGLKGIEADIKKLEKLTAKKLK